MQNSSKLLTPNSKNPGGASEGGVGGGGESDGQQQAPPQNSTKTTEDSMGEGGSPLFERSFYPSGDDVSEKNRMRALKELMDSETVYFTQMKTLVYYFIDPLQRMGSWGIETFKIINVAGAFQQLGIVCELTKKILYGCPLPPYFLSTNKTSKRGVAGETQPTRRGGGAGGQYIQAIGSDAEDVWRLCKQLRGDCEKSRYPPQEEYLSSLGEGHSGTP